MSLSSLTLACREGDGADRPSTSGASSFAATRLSYDEVIAAAEGPVGQPLRDASLSATESVELERAVWIMRQPCMAAAGYHEIPFASAPPPLLDEISWERRYLYVRPSEARAVGYGEPTIADEAYRRYAEASQARQMAMTPDEAQAYGSTELRCTGAAREELCKGLHSDGQPSYCERLEAIATHDAPDALVAARASVAVQDAIGRWSACMRARGHAYDDIDAAWNAGLDRSDDGAIALAVDDTDCKDESKLFVVWATVDGLIQGEMAEREPERFRDIGRHKDELRRRIAAVIESKG